MILFYIFSKDKLSKEEKSTKFNLNKLQNQWRVIMREGQLSLLKPSISFQKILS